MAKAPCSQCRGLGLIPGQGTRSHMPEVRVHMLQLKIVQPTNLLSCRKPAAGPQPEGVPLGEPGHHCGGNMDDGEELQT